MFGNLFTGIPAELPAELCEVLASGKGVRVERIVSRGHASPEGFWYDQDTTELVLLVRGRARLRVEGVGPVLTLAEGDHIVLEAHVRHRVEWTDPERDTVWLAVHY